MAIDLSPNAENKNEGNQERDFAPSAPRPVDIVKVDDANTPIPGLTNLGIGDISAERESHIKSVSDDVVKSLFSAELNSPEFRNSVADLTSLAQDTMMEVGQAPSSLLNRRMKDMSSERGSAQDKVAKTLTELNSTIEDISGNRSTMSKFMRIFPGGNKVDNIMKRFQTAQATIENIQESLAIGEEKLSEDNVELGVQQERLRNSTMELYEYMRLADAVTARTKERLEEMKRSPKPEEREMAVEYESSVLFPLQQRRQDLRTQIAVAVQSFATMELVRQNNVELIKGVQRTRSTTMTALNTTVMVSAAQQQQTEVIRATKAVKDVTESLMDQNSKDLRQNTLSIREAAVAETIDPAVIQRSLEAVTDTANAVRAFQEKANSAQEQSIRNIDSALSKSGRALGAIKSLGSGTPDNLSITN